MRKVGEKTFRKYIWIASSIVLVITVLLASQIKNVRFDYNFERFFPEADEDTQFFEEFRETFSSDNDFITIAIPARNGIFNKKFLKKIDRYTKELEKHDLVKFAMSITNQEEHFIFAMGNTDSKPYIDFNDFDPERDSSRIYQKEELINSLVSKDGTAVGLFVRHQDYISKKNSDRLIEDLYALNEKFGFKDVKMSGRTVGQKYYIDTMAFEMVLFLSMSVALVIIFLIIAFRSLWGWMVPQVVIALGLIWLIGGMGLFDKPINIILTVLPSIMFVVSMSDSIHLVSRYLDALRTEDSTFKAIKMAIREVGLATFLTSVTTAIGFFSLYFVKVQPIKIFGMVMGVGVLLAFVITFAILPVLFYLFPGPKYVIKKKEDHFWKKHLDRWFLKVIRKPKLILWIGGLIMLVSIVGMTKIETNRYLMDDLSEKEPLKQDFNYMDTVFGGVRPFTMVVSLKDTSKTIWDPELLAEIDTAEQALRDIYGVQIRSSLVTALKIINRGSHAGNSEYYKLPTSKRKLRSFRQNLRIAEQGKVINTMLDTTETILAIGGTMGDLGNIIVTKRRNKYMGFLKSRKLDDVLDFRITGSAFLIDKNMSYLSQSMIKGLGVSILIVALIMGLIYQSGRVLLISLIPNVFPLFFIAGIMGYFNVPLSTSTAIIFTISFGIAVDDTIHFLGKYKYELLKGRGKLYALKRSYMTTGKAMILTSLILCSGFLLLIMSSFNGTYYMGVLLCVTLMVALIADLTILPILMLLFYKEKAPKKS